MCGGSRRLSYPNTKGNPNHGYLDKTLSLLWGCGANNRAALRHLWTSYARFGATGDRRAC